MILNSIVARRAPCVSRYARVQCTVLQADARPGDSVILVGSSPLDWKPEVTKVKLKRADALAAWQTHFWILEGSSLRYKIAIIRAPSSGAHQQPLHVEWEQPEPRSDRPTVTSDSARQSPTARQ